MKDKLAGTASGRVIKVFGNTLFPDDRRGSKILNIQIGEEVSVKAGETLSLHIGPSGGVSQILVLPAPKKEKGKLVPGDEGVSD